jgi:hypothetical protein
LCDEEKEDHKNKIEPFTIFTLHHAAQKKPQQASKKIKDIKIRKIKLQNLCKIDNFVDLEHASGWVRKPKPLHLHVNKLYMVCESFLHPFGQAKAPQCITRLSPSNCTQQKSKVLIPVPRVATGNPGKPTAEVLSTISKALWMPLKLATF